jgi:hypothetical protein
MELKLYTISDVQTMLGVSGKELSQATLAEEIRESRCYREIGGLIRMTEGDVLAFLSWCSPRRAPGGTPADHEAGQIVVIGNSLERDGLVYVNWCPYGKELSLLDTVREGCAESVEILGMWDAQFQEYRDLTVKWTKEKRRYGKGGRWFVPIVKDEIKEKLDELEEAS